MGSRICSEKLWRCSGSFWGKRHTLREAQQKYSVGRNSEVHSQMMLFWPHHHKGCPSRCSALDTTKAIMPRKNRRKGYCVGSALHLLLYQSRVLPSPYTHVQFLVRPTTGRI